MRFVVNTLEDISNIPDHVTHVTFGDTFDRPLRVGYVPNTVTHLTFGDMSGHPLKVGHIPDSVTHLTFGHFFNQPLEKGHIPDSVTHLVFGHFFNQPLEKGHIPDSVTHLAFRGGYTQPLGKCSFPDSVTHLTFGYAFRQKIYAKILSNVTTITLTCNYLMADLSDVPLNIRIYFRVLQGTPTIILSDVRHMVYVNSSHLDNKIIGGELLSVHYVDTVEEEGETYLRVHGPDYVPLTRAKSARK